MEEKISLPKKTKIAAQWIKLLTQLGIAGIIGIGIIFPLIYKPGFEKILEKISPEKYFSGIILGFILLAFLFWSSLQLIRGKRWAWWICVIYLSILSLADIFRLPDIFRLAVTPGDIVRFGSKFFFDFFVIFIPLILLLLDRKNFWKVAT